MEATRVLMDEHRVIEQVLDCLTEMTRVADREGRIDAGAAREAVEFFRNFADGCHHAKEEDRLFPLMEQHGFSAHSGPTAVMRSEHEQGRELVGRIADSIDGAAAGNAEDVARFVRSARSYAQMLRAHIEKEDHCLFPMAEQSLGQDELRQLQRDFEQVDRDETGANPHERWVQVANSLADRFGARHAGGSAPTGKV